MLSLTLQFDQKNRLSATTHFKERDLPATLTKKLLNLLAKMKRQATRIILGLQVKGIE